MRIGYTPQSIPGPVGVCYGRAAGRVGAAALLATVVCLVTPGVRGAASLDRPVGDQTPLRAPQEEAAASSSDWVDEVLELLRWLYEILGGNPADLEAGVEEAMRQIREKYDADGVPTGLTTAGRDEALGVIDRIHTRLDDAPTGMSPAGIALFNAMLERLGEDLAGTGG